MARRGRGITSICATQTCRMLRPCVVHSYDSSQVACDVLPDRTEAAIVLRCLQSTAGRDSVKIRAPPNGSPLSHAAPHHNAATVTSADPRPGARWRQTLIQFGPSPHLAPGEHTRRSPPHRPTNTDQSPRARRRPTRRSRPDRRLCAWRSPARPPSTPEPTRATRPAPAPRAQPTRALRFSLASSRSDTS